MSSAIFPVVGPFEQLEADELARAEDVMYNFNLLRVWANALALPATGWGVDGHGDLSGSTAIMHSAASSEIADAGSYFTGTTVEAALQEAGADIVALQTAAATGFRFIGKSKDATERQNAAGISTATITVPAGTSTVGVQVFLKASFKNFLTSYIELYRDAVLVGRTIQQATSFLAAYATENTYHTIVVADGWDNTADVVFTVTYLAQATEYVKDIELSVFAL